MILLILINYSFTLPRRALFDKSPDGRENSPLVRSKLPSNLVHPRHSHLSGQHQHLSPPTSSATGLLGNFEESVLNGRLEPASLVNGFTAEIGASGSFCPKHKTLPVTVFFYTLHDAEKGDGVSSPYLGHINLGHKGYLVPKVGTVQVVSFN